MKITALNPADASTRVYQYGIRIDDASRELIRQQFFLAHQTYNDIIAEIRRVTEAASVWLQDMAGPEALSLRAKIDVLSEQFDKAKAEDNRDALKEIAQERSGLWREWYQLMHNARRANSAELAIRLRDIGERTNCSIYRIRCAAVQQGLGWATANAVLKAAIQAYRKQWPKFKKPNFRRIADIPRKALELQFTTSGGIPADSILNKKCPEIYIHQNPSKKYADFTFRVGAGNARQDVLGTVYYHRSLPPDGKIKYARIIEQRIGKDFKYYLQFVVTDILGSETANDVKSSIAALDFGWYFEDDGRRIAGFIDCGNPDKAEIIRLPTEIDELLIRSEEFKSKRDMSRDEIVSYLRDIAFENEPEAIQEELAKIRKMPAHYIASRRLARLVLKWRSECPNYRPAVFDKLECWRRIDKMRLQAETHLASRARGRRKKYYEALALDWTKRYGIIVIDTPDLSETAKVKDNTTGRHNKLGGMARGGRVKAALYDLEQCLVNAASRTGTRLMKIKGRTSKTCSHCGGSVTTQNDGDREVHCSSCGETIDRERNAAAVVWLQGMAQMETIQQSFLDAQAKRSNTLEKRQMIKSIRMQARWAARTASSQ